MERLLRRRGGRLLDDGHCIGPTKTIAAMDIGQLTAVHTLDNVIIKQKYGKTVEEARWSFARRRPVVRTLIYKCGDPCKRISTRFDKWLSVSEVSARQRRSPRWTLDN
ncbi:hypothetical protein J6590_027095 [Homalodisca vitripennis]|nr:hypothetical protein J6590_027095 [Homalodisca vitripennis]